MFHKKNEMMEDDIGIGKQSFDLMLQECKTSALLGPDSLLLAMEKLQNFLRNQSHKTGSSNPRKEDNTILEGYANEIYNIEFVRSGAGDSLERKIQEMMDSCLDLCGADNAFLAAVQVVRQSSSQEKGTQNIASLLSSLHYMRRVLFQVGLLSELIHAQYDDSSPKHVKEESMKQFVNTIHLLPGQVANACHRVSLKLPEWSKRQAFSKGVLEGVVALNAEIGSTSTTDTITSSPLQMFFDCMVEKMLLLNRQDEIAAAFITLISRESGSDGHSCMGDIEESIVECISRVSSERQKTRLICSILKNVVNNLEFLPMTLDDDDKFEFCKKYCISILKRLCLSTLQSSKAIRDTFVNIMIFSPGLTTDPIESCILVQCTVLLLSQCEESLESDDSSESSSDEEDPSKRDEGISNYSVLMSYLVDVAILWSGNQFISKTDKSQKLHISYFIRCSLVFIDKTSQTVIQQEALHELIPGITNRLSVSDQDVRIEGMQIAESIAPLLGQTLKFDELDSIRRKDSMVDKEIEDQSARKKEQKTKVRSKSKLAEKLQITEIDPDEQYQSQDEEDSESESLTDIDDNNSSDSDWDESNLPTYHIEDKEEDLNIIPRPYYLQQCIEMLTADGEGHEDVCKMKVALTEIPGLVRSQPPDLEDFAVVLANELLHKENKYNLDDFEELSCSGLISLLVHAPNVTVGFIHRQLFGELCMDKRLIILSVMQASAAELSGENQLALIREGQR